MSFAVRTGVAVALLAGVLAARAGAENEGQTDLDKATEAKITATTLSDLGEVIRLVESALEKGLDEGNAKFARQMLADARMRRGMSVAQTIFGGGRPDPRWPQFRQLALGDLDRALEIDPAQPKVWLVVAQLNLLPGGDRKRAAQALDEAVQRAGEDASLKAQAFVLRAALADDTEKKLADLGDAIRADPSNVTALRARAALLEDQKKWKAALADVDAALKIDANDAGTNLERGVLLIEMGRLDDALAALDRAHELAPKSAAPLVRRGQALGLQKKFDEALAALNDGYALEPDNLALLLIRASVLQELGKTDKALADVDRVLKLKPGLAPAIQLRVRLLAGSGEFKEAIDQLEALQKSSPGDVDVSLQLAMFYNAEKRPRKAIEIYTQILADHPDNGLALHGRGDALLAVGKHAEAIADYEKAYKLLDDDPSLLNNFAWVLATSPDAKLRDGKRALEMATEACRLTDYKAAHILSTLAAAYAELGNFESARKWSAKAVELGDEEQKDELAKELESYRQNKPVRERQETPEGKEEPSDKGRPTKGEPARPLVPQRDKPAAEHLSKPDKDGASEPAGQQPSESKP